MHASIGIERATWSNYERGETEPGIDIIQKIANFFSVQIDDLIQRNIAEGNLIPVKEGTKNTKKGNLKGKLKGNLFDKNSQNNDNLSVVSEPTFEQEVMNRMPLVITVDSQGNENVVLVQVKARAGYLSGYSDPEFMEKLPAYRLPGLNHGTFRLFEVDGLSMYPTLNSGDLVICSNVEQISVVRDDRVHVVVTKTDGVVVKRVLNRLKTDGKLILKSDNYKDRDLYPPIVCDPSDILEIWYATGYISRQMRPPAEMYTRLVDLEGRFTLLEDSVKKSKKK